MNMASLFFAPLKTESLFPNKLIEDSSPNQSTITSSNNLQTIASSNGFRKIKKETEPLKIAEEQKISNPFTQSLPQNMLKLLQMMGQTQKALIPEPQTQAIQKIQSFFETLRAKKEVQEHENENQINPQNSVKAQAKFHPNVLLVNEGQDSGIDKSSFLNKNLYVELLASLYKQSKQAPKTSEDITKILPAGLNGSNTEAFAFPIMKKENSSQQEENESDESNDNIKGKSKKIKKVNLLCGHYNREHYAKNLCNNCYHKYGRTKKPWNCSHEKLYAHGLCQNCYINKYNQQKKNKMKILDNAEKPEGISVKVIEEEEEKDTNSKTAIEEEASVKNEEQK